MSNLVSNQRTKNYLTQIKGAVVFKAGAVLASFLVIPIMIDYLGQEQFGVWSTLLTIISWVVFFDLGVGNGLKNKVAEALSKNNRDEAISYIGSGYGLIAIVSLFLWLIVNFISFFIPWQKFFNTTIVSESTLHSTVAIALSFIILNFWLGLISALLGAIQKTSLISLGQLISNCAALALVFLLSKTTNSSIVYLAIIYGVTAAFANIILSFWFFRRFPELRPTLKLDVVHIRPLLAVGLKFFIIQLAFLVIFTTDKFLITQIFGPVYVTQYEIVFKLFSIVTFLHSLITTPLWSAYTDAYHREDYDWIRKMIKKQIYIFAIIVVGVLFLGLIARTVIGLWVGSDVRIAPMLIPAMCIMILISIWSNIFAYFLNGVQKIHISLIVSSISMMVNIPISIFLAINTDLGVGSVVIGTSVALLLPSIFGPIQVMKILNRRDYGMWGR